MLPFDVASSRPFIKSMPWADLQHLSLLQCPSLHRQMARTTEGCVMNREPLGSKRGPASVSSGLGRQGSPLPMRATHVTRCALESQASQTHTEIAAKADDVLNT